MFTRILVFKAVYIVLHNSYAFFEFLVNIWVYLNRKFLKFYHTFVLSNDREYVFKSVKKLDKIPTHLTILLGNEEPSYIDLANLVMWSLAAGISFISFYDYKGTLMKGEDKLQQEVERRKDNDYHIIWYNSENPCKNGFIGKKIHVRTLSLIDAQDSVINVVRQMCSAKDTVIDQEVVDSYLKSDYIFPDPELGLYCGKIFSLYGYPPWQIRVTEFLRVETHHSISPQVFVKALFRFNKIEQRFGK